MPTVTKPGQWIESFFPKAMTMEQVKAWKNIWWRVALMHIPPRDDRFQFERDFGMGQIQAALNKEPLNMGRVTKTGKGQQIMFVFPERWLSTQEEQLFIPALYENKQIKDAGLTIIDIVTKSPLIIGNFIKEDIRIIRTEG
jgi:hypothetical protein